MLITLYLVIALACAFHCTLSLLLELTKYVNDSLGLLTFLHESVFFLQYTTKSFQLYHPSLSCVTYTPLC